MEEMLNNFGGRKDCVCYERVDVRYSGFIK
jgi:hypothetical protein